ALLHLHRDPHEADLRAALGESHTREPEATVVQAVLDGDRGDLGLHRRDHRLDPDWHIVHRLWVFFCSHRPDVHRHGETICGADELAGLRIEPQRAHTEIPPGLSRPDLE